MFGTFLTWTFAAYAEQDGEETYKKLSKAMSDDDNALFEKLNTQAQSLDWETSKEIEFKGNLRLLQTKGDKKLYLVRELSGDLYILSLPEDSAKLEADADSDYAGLDKMRENKMVFKLKIIEKTVDGETYHFASFAEKPQQVTLDRIFKILIILMLFFVMVGMGLTLSLKDFALVFKKPGGIIVGEVLQFGIMPLVALGVGHLLGFYEHYPFVYVGMILIVASPGGVTSNLMTHFAKGDLALSISLTSFSTALSIVFTPLLLALYCSNVPEVNIPVKTVVLTIIILVLIPLVIGMGVRSKWENFAEKSTKFFSILGLIALLFLILVGIISNLDKFGDTDRYGVAFYSMVFLLTALGMLVGGIAPKLVGINNYQTRAICLESGLRNASLAMAIAILIQDAMGDFHSSMFFVSGIFGLSMYIAGFLSISVFKKALPLEAEPAE